MSDERPKKKTVAGFDTLLERANQTTATAEDVGRENSREARRRAVARLRPPTTSRHLP
jgi:hypothetical protein